MRKAAPAILLLAILAWPPAAAQTRFHWTLGAGSFLAFRQTLGEWSENGASMDADVWLQFRYSLDEEYDASIDIRRFGSYLGRYRGCELRWGGFGSVLGLRRVWHRRPLAAYAGAGVMYYNENANYSPDTSAVESVMLEQHGGGGVCLVCGTEWRPLRWLSVPVEFVWMGAVTRGFSTGMGVTAGLCYSWGEVD